jgi:hypothetical protein
MAEQRDRAERFPLPLPVRYRTDAAAEWLSGTTKNISGTGILFAADQELTVGAVIEMELAMEADGESWPSKIVARARVVRIASPAAISAPAAIAAKFVDHRLLPRQLGQA